MAGFCWVLALFFYPRKTVLPLVEHGHPGILPGGPLPGWAQPQTSEPPMRHGSGAGPLAWGCLREYSNSLGPDPAGGGQDVSPLFSAGPELQRDQRKA